MRTQSLGEDSLGLYRLKESEQIMKATVNLNQILQGGLAGLVAWLFKTVNDLQKEVAVLMVQITDAKEDLLKLAMREQELNSAITEILIRLGGN